MWAYIPKKSEKEEKKKLIKKFKWVKTPSIAKHKQRKTE